MVWSVAPGTQALSSAAVGGGLAEPSWLLNIGVPADYDRVDLDEHAGEIAQRLSLEGDGVALFTSAHLDRWQRGTDGGVVVDCTAGISKPTFAASADDGWSPWSPGTINTVAFVPASLTTAAAVNAVITITEAKSQALADLEVPGTGTASDAVVVLWPSGEPAEPFCGPRSEWGSPLARATFDAVRSTCIASHEGLTR